MGLVGSRELLKYHKEGWIGARWGSVVVVVDRGAAPGRTAGRGRAATAYGRATGRWTAAASARAASAAGRDTVSTSWWWSCARGRGLDRGEADALLLLLWLRLGASQRIEWWRTWRRRRDGAGHEARGGRLR